MNSLLQAWVTLSKDGWLASSFKWLGLLVVAFVTTRIFAFFARLAVSPRSVNWKRLAGAQVTGKAKGAKLRAGSSANWAVVSGASDGIGKEFALQLARKGFNVFLIGRNEEKLAKVAGEIESASGVKTECYLLDYADPAKDAFSKLALKAEKLPITVLVNNAGVSHEMPTAFVDETPLNIASIIQVNCTSTVLVTRAILPGILNRGQGGLVLNMGSESAELKTPMLQTYAGSKAFLRTWSECLAQEVAGSSVHVELLNTHYVATNMSKIRRSSFTIPSPRDYVAAVLNRCGSSYFSVPHPGHALAVAAIHLVPEWILQPIVLKQMMAIRKHALLKASKKK